MDTSIYTCCRCDKGKAHKGELPEIHELVDFGIPKEALHLELDYRNSSKALFRLAKSGNPRWLIRFSTSHPGHLALVFYSKATKKVNDVGHILLCWNRFGDGTLWMGMCNRILHPRFEKILEQLDIQSIGYLGEIPKAPLVKRYDNFENVVKV
jgi:hypothetical protein